MVFDHRLTRRGVFKMRAAPARTAGDSGELDADLIDSLIQARYVVRVELAKCRGEGFDVIKTHFVSFPKASEGVSSPCGRRVTASGVRGIADFIPCLRAKYALDSQCRSGG